MRTSQAGRSTPAGLAGRLLLALALCACGGVGGGGGRAADREQGADPGAGTAVASAASAADTCTGPPPAFQQTVLMGPWQALLDSLNAHGVAFPEVAGNDATTTVKLCRDCTSVRVQIRASNLTPCLKPSDLKQSHQRILGMFVVRDTFPAQHGWDTLYPGDTLFTFTRVEAGPATLVYNQGGSGKASPSTAWMFWYCRDSHSNPKTAQAQWRPRGTPPVGTPPADVDEDGGGTYGWMACASGCCQFYTPPPNQEEFLIETPHKANPNAPDTVGRGQNQGTKPYWCNAPA